jgi:hypothetical protein
MGGRDGLVATHNETAADWSLQQLSRGLFSCAVARGVPEMTTTEKGDRPECCYFKPSVQGYYGTVKNFTEGREGHEGKNPPSSYALRATADKSRYALRRASRRSPPGSNVGALKPVPTVPRGVRWAPPAAAVEPFRPSRPSVNGFRF